jgi:hypothetical protein
MNNRPVKAAAVQWNVSLTTIIRITISGITLMRIELSRRRLIRQNLRADAANVGLPMLRILERDKVKHFRL